MSQHEQAAQAPAPEGVAPVQVATEKPSPVPGTTITTEVPAGELRLEKGATVLRTTKVEVPDDDLKDLVVFLKAAQSAYLTAGLAKARDPKSKPDRLLAPIESMGINYDKEPNRRVRIGMAVNTYAIISEGKNGLIIRYYAQIPAAFSDAITRLLSEFPLAIEASKDSFLRPSGI